LDFLRVDQTGQIGVGESNSRKTESNLEFGGRLVGSIQAVELLESGFGPDDEASEMSSGSELEKVQSMNIQEIDTRDVTKGLYERSIFFKDDQWSSPFDIASVPHFTPTSTDLLRVNDLLNVGVGLQSLQDGDSLFGLLDIDDGVVGDDERDFGDPVDSVSASENKSG